MSLQPTFWTIINTCLAYLAYVCLVLWMLFKECLGYEVDWSRGPPLTPPQREELEALENGQRFPNRNAGLTDVRVMNGGSKLGT
jgi:hypothetical protein